MRESTLYIEKVVMSCDVITLNPRSWFVSLESNHEKESRSGSVYCIRPLTMVAVQDTIGAVTVGVGQGWN